MLLAVVISSCTTTAPRFRSGGSSTNTGASDDAAVASIVINETRAEDDRKVDPKHFQAIVHEHNAADTLDDTPAGLSRDKLLLDIVGFLGVPYKYGGQTRSGVDCSGFTALMYSSAASRQLPRSTVEQFATGNPVSDGKLRFGDLVFFNTTGRSPSHVGIFLEEDLFAHASVSDGVTLSSLQSTYYKKRFIGARRILP
jgi:cell wall-associated NlpC family hydrolase